jgi:hypothetical protein
LEKISLKKCTSEIEEQGRALLWRPRFLITVINANGRISRVKPVKPRSNLGQPGSSPENLVNEPRWTPWPSLQPRVVNPWSKTRSNPA